MKLTFALVAALFLLLLNCGCNDSQADAHTDDHHLEHFVPHHKPANLAESVDEIEHRCEHLAGHAGHGHDDEADEFQEILDIVNWIPELAADSDLDEAKWNQAVSAANAIADQLIFRKSPDGSLDLSDLLKAIDTELKTLQTLVPEAGKPETAIHHDHHHDHDHGHDDHHGPDHEQH